MKILTVAEMQAVDRAASEQYGIPPLQLMDQAGESLARRALTLLPAGRPRVAVLAGGGKNGGDGLAAARQLAAAGVQVSAFLFAGHRLADETLSQLKRLPPQVSLTQVEDGFPAALAECFTTSDLVVDALLGIGLSGPPREPMATAIRALNDSGVNVLAADVPSGLDADTGRPQEPAVRACVTLTFGAPKAGLLEEAAGEFVGRLEVDPIGFPPALLAASGEEAYFDRRSAETLLPRRPANAHKRSAGTVLIIGGSTQYHGAPVLAAAGAVRAGAGFVTVAYPRELDRLLRSWLLEELCLPVAASPAGLKQMLAAAGSCGSVVIGPGLGRSPASAKTVRDFAAAVSGPRALIVDADALAALKPGRRKGRRSGPELVLTPHAGEAARLLGVADRIPEGGRWAAARELARRCQATVVLKGRHTAVAGPSGSLRVIGAGTQALATAGTGDVLAGAIAALAAQSLPVFDAACLGAYLHGLAGELACPDPLGLGLRAREVAEKLPAAIRCLRLHIRP